MTTISSFLQLIGQVHSCFGETIAFDFDGKLTQSAAKVTTLREKTFARIKFDDFANFSQIRKMLHLPV